MTLFKMKRKLSCKILIEDMKCSFYIFSHTDNILSHYMIKTHIQICFQYNNFERVLKR